ncbi:hypothetical protein PS723_04430 [Pseudomonas fluorescens]|uniref:Uncharacterized protein n=1 Tax=Pseudomonas fluorescens TaxID=294 RepID=A0A5E7EAV6_PSEFL|nr:hypothetical protein PS723_04430 [Pseudomonas fluorescens]
MDDSQKPHEQGKWNVQTSTTKNQASGFSLRFGCQSFVYCWLRE